MTEEHLPECPMSTKDAICCSLACICEALRACEQRVLNAAVQRVEEMAIPHAFPVTVTCDVWNQAISQCITAVKGDQQ